MFLFLPDRLDRSSNLDLSGSGNSVQIGLFSTIAITLKVFNKQYNIYKLMSIIKPVAQEYQS